jgi:hypothetical protein
MLCRIQSVYHETLNGWKMEQLEPDHHLPSVKFIRETFKILKTKHSLPSPFVVLSNHYVCGIFRSSPRHRWSCLLLPTLKSLCAVQVGMKVKSYLHCIYCKVNTRIQGEKCHTLRSRYACVWNIYMVAILILLCSLNHASLVWNLENTFAREHGLSFSFLLFFFFFSSFSFFHSRHLSTHCFRYLGHLSIFLILFFLHSHKPLSAIGKL